MDLAHRSRLKQPRRALLSAAASISAPVPTTCGGVHPASIRDARGGRDPAPAWCALDRHDEVSRGPIHRTALTARCGRSSRKASARPRVGVGLARQGASLVIGRARDLLARHHPSRARGLAAHRPGRWGSGGPPPRFAGAPLHRGAHHFGRRRRERHRPGPRRDRARRWADLTVCEAPADARWRLRTPTISP